MFVGIQNMGEPVETLAKIIKTILLLLPVFGVLILYGTEFKTLGGTLILLAYIIKTFQEKNIGGDLN